MRWKTANICALTVLASSFLVVALGGALSKPAVADQDSHPPSQPAPVPPAAARVSVVRNVVVIGDSYTGGSREGGIGPSNWTMLVWNSLEANGIDVNAEVSGRGGSGYVQRGIDGTVFGEEASRLVRPDDDLIVFFGSINDIEQSIESVSGAASAAFGQAHATAPKARIVVIAPVWPHPGGAPAEILRIRDVLADGAKQVGAAFVDPIAQGWLTNTPDLIGADNVHPNDAGHAFLAQQIGPHLRAALTGH